MSVADAPRPVVMDRVEVLAPEWLEGLTEAWNAGFGTKMCCACCPGSESVAQVRRRYAKYKPDKWEMGAVAVAQEGTVLGFVQMGLQGQPLYPEGLHTVKEGECYVEFLSVTAQARGQGVGTKLLQWGEERAREHNATELTLSVLNGNPAKRLYERFGFVAQPMTWWQRCMDCVCVTVLMGRPYGCCHRDWGSTFMVKDLTTREPPASSQTQPQPTREGDVSAHDAEATGAAVVANETAV